MSFRPPIRRVLPLAVALGSSAAHAETKFFVELAYQPDPAVEGCPSDAEFRTMISDQLGYEPFRAGSAQTVVARAQAAERGLKGFVEWHDSSGSLRGERELGTESNDCKELARAMSFAIAVQIQLLAQEAEASEPLAEKESTEPPSASAEQRDEPLHDERSTSLRPKPDRARWQFLLGAGPTFAFGLAPRPAIEGRLLAGARHGHLGFELGAEASLPSTYTTENGNGFEQQVVAGSVGACVLFRSLSGCMLGKVGRLSVRGFGIDAPNSDAGTLAQIGPRLTLERVFDDRWFGALRVEALAALARWEVTLNEREVWETPLFSLAVGGDLGVVLP